MDMRNAYSCQVARLLLITAALSAPLWGKDVPVSLDQCPAPVQATVRQYAAHGTLEAIALDEKKKTGGPAVYEAKFNLPTGKRIEVHISPEGKILLVENKQPKK
jgi:hypothetical protein